MFADRVHAGRLLADALSQYRGAPDTVVLGIPRGGVVVAAEVAERLGLPLDVAVAAKVGAPDNPEYAIGAVAQDGEVTANPTSGFSIGEVRRLSGAALTKVQRYVADLRQGMPELELAGKTALLIDDGLATGLTAIVAADWLRRQGVARSVVAVPVASASAMASLRKHADEVVSVDVPVGFYAVGQFYRTFDQTEDDEVRELLVSQHAVGRT